MCNIAGYAGNKQAAPILLEMLKPYDDIAECIATVLPEKAKIIFLEEFVYSISSNRTYSEYS